MNAQAKRKAVSTRRPSRARVFSDLVSIIDQYNDAEKKALARRADVHWVTLYAWVSGATRNPHIATLVKVARALGYDIVLQRQGKRKPRLTRVK